MPGLVHIYCGDGKGKTTASVGLAVRAAGAGKRVLFIQFYKDGSSSEIGVLKSIPGITVRVCPTKYGFYKRMTPEQRAQAAADYTSLLRGALAEAENADLLILDESISACNHGSIPEAELIGFLKNRHSGLEVVLTGRAPSPALQEQADYITCMTKEKHPFDRGIGARKGIEF